MRAILSAGLLLFAAACTVGGEPPEGSARIDVREAYITQPAEGEDTALAGMYISLEGAPRTLIGAQSSIASRVELHTLSEDGGMMRMRRVEGFNVAEDMPLSLDTGGNHLMLFGVTKPLQLGSTVDLVLTFEIAEGHEQDVLATAEIVPAPE